MSGLQSFRHPTLYFQDGTLVLRAGDGSGTLYNVYRAPLLVQSEFFAGMLNLPAPNNPPPSLTASARECLKEAKNRGHEGGLDETAVEIPGQFKASEVEVFLEFLFLQGWTNVPSLDDAIGILKLSHFFAVEKGIGYARFHLDNHPGLDSFVRLKMGFTFHFRDWIKKAFDELMAVPINSISTENEEFIEWPAYRALAKAQAEVLDHRLTLAVNPPDANHCNDCYSIPYCGSQWRAGWTSISGVLGDLIVDELAGSVIYDKLGMYEFPGMVGECLRRTVVGLQDESDGKSILKKEEDIVDRTVVQLMNQLKIS
ncbi:hypothetical protein C8F04DRAFT_1364796 [Mycena alexandri]|uniref:BTB domain-containing protein n=1 Tax=Mycena alexandri TaxID=1745969 RepID=A0AAD6SR56_9AGAR|nr:hypothetical protein C8F04DRAFT_1364796 [Mycena alexandri]